MFGHIQFKCNHSNRRKGLCVGQQCEFFVQHDEFHRFCVSYREQYFVLLESRVWMRKIRNIKTSSRVRFPRLRSISSVVNVASRDSAKQRLRRVVRIDCESLHTVMSCPIHIVCPYGSCNEWGRNTPYVVFEREARELQSYLSLSQVASS